MSREEQPTLPDVELPSIEEERRATVRRVCRGAYPCRLLVRPSSGHGGPPLTDIPPPAPGLSLSRPLVPGPVLPRQLPRLRPGMSLIHSARVIHVTPHAGQWLHGCELSCPLSDEEL